MRALSRTRQRQSPWHAHSSHMALFEEKEDIEDCEPTAEELDASLNQSACGFSLKLHGIPRGVPAGRRFQLLARLHCAIEKVLFGGNEGAAPALEYQYQLDWENRTGGWVIISGFNLAQQIKLFENSSVFHIDDVHTLVFDRPYAYRCILKREWAELRALSRQPAPARTYISVATRVVDTYEVERVNRLAHDTNTTMVEVDIVKIAHVKI
jgi:hypothetical protein